MWLWGPRIQFWWDRKQVARALRELRGGGDEAAGESVSTVPIDLEARSLALAERVDPRHVFVLDGHRVEVAGVRPVSAADTPEMQVLRREGLIVTFLASQFNDLRDPAAGSIVSPLARSAGGRAIREYLSANSPAQLLRDVSQAAPSDMDSASGTPAKYVALYRNCMKSVLVPHVGVWGARELTRDDLIAFVFGDIAKDRVVIEAYCAETRRFVTIVCEPQRPGAASMGDIEDILAALRISRPGEPPQKPPP